MPSPTWCISLMCPLLTVLRQSLTTCSLVFAASASSLALFAGRPTFCGPGDAGFVTPIISSCNLLRFCSGVSSHAELSSSRMFGPFAPLPVLNPRGRCFVGSIRAARSSCLGGIIIQSSRCSFSGADGRPAEPSWVLSSSSFVAADFCNQHMMCSTVQA